MLNNALFVDSGGVNNAGRECWHHPSEVTICRSTDTASTTGKSSVFPSLLPLCDLLRHSDHPGDNV